MIKAITVKLNNVVPADPPAFDDFGVPITTESPVDVADVLVYPTSADAVVTDLQLYGRRSAYQLCIPKGDTHTWEDRVVEFFGKKFRTFGPCAEYIEENTPLRWNKWIRCELYE